MPPGSLGNGEAAERVAEMIEAGRGDGLREHLMYFAIRVGRAPAQRHRGLPARWPGTAKAPPSPRRRPGWSARCSTRW